MGRGSNTPGKRASGGSAKTQNSTSLLDKAWNDATKILSDAGISRYERIEKPNIPLNSEKAYYKISEAINNGQEVTQNYSKKVLTDVKAQAEYDLAYNAMWILGSSGTKEGWEEPFAKDYFTSKNNSNKLIEFCDSKLNSNGEKKTVKKTVKRTTTSKPRVNGYGEATSREITSSTYKRAQSRLDKAVRSWFGRGM